jgi:hypothetical protein
MDVDLRLIAVWRSRRHGAHLRPRSAIQASRRAFETLKEGRRSAAAGGARLQLRREKLVINNRVLCRCWSLPPSAC